MAVLNTTVPFIYYKVSVIQPNFDFLFQIDQNSDLLVQLNGTDLVLSTDYTIILNGTLGGTVVLDAAIVANLQLNDILYLARQISLNRLTNYEDGQDFSADVLNKDLDRITLQNQQVNAAYVGQSFIFPTDYTDGNAAGFNLLPSDIPQNSFLKKIGTGFAAVQIEENPNCSTLRSDLLSDSPPGSTGSVIVGATDLDGNNNTVQGTLNQLPIDTMGNEGAAKIGATDLDDNPSTVQLTFDQLANTTFPNEGAAKIGATDLDGSASTVQATLNQLPVTTPSNEGASKIGATSPDLTSSQIQAILTRFLPKAWAHVIFTGPATYTVNGAAPNHNIQSVTRISQGIVEILMTIALPSSNYHVQARVLKLGDLVATSSSTPFTTTTFRLQFVSFSISFQDVDFSVQVYEYT